MPPWYEVSTPLIATAAAAVVVPLATWAVLRRRYRRQIAELQLRLERSDRRDVESTRSVSSLSAQVASLRTELRKQEEQSEVAVARARSVAEQESESWRQIKAMNELFVEPRRTARVADFEDTQIL